MTEYTKLMNDIVVTDDEMEPLQLETKRAKFSVCCTVTTFSIFATVFLFVGSVILMSHKPLPPTEAQLVIKNLLEAPDLEAGVQNFTEDTAYSERVRLNIRNMLLNKTMLMYQPRIEPIRPFANMYSTYQVEPHYKLSACETPKAMATTLHGIFCYLYDTEAFEKKKLNLETVYWNEPLCDWKKIPTAPSTAQLTDYLPAEHNSFQIVREPIKRFVSAYINKCIDEYETDPAHPNWKYCYDCKEDIECVITKAHHDIMKRSRYDRTFQGPEDNRYFSSHFYPLTWQCDLPIRYETVHFIRYVSGGAEKADMVNQLLSVMQKSGVEYYKLKKIGGVLLDDKPLTHATKGTSLPHQLLEKIYNSQKMLDILISLYYYDYLVFEYPLPKLGKISEFD